MGKPRLMAKLVNLLVCHRSCVMKKPVFRVSDQVLLKPGCTTTEDGYRFEISDLLI